MSSISEAIAKRREELAGGKTNIAGQIAKRREELATRTVPQDALDRADAADQKVMDALTLERESTFMKGAVPALSGVPFVGEYVDEAIGALNGPEARDRIRAVQGAMTREHPYTDTALRMGGGIIGSIPMAAAAAPAAGAMAPTSLAAQTATVGTAGAIIGGVDGALSGYGRGETPEDRREQAVSGGGAGAVFGAGFGALAPWASRGMSNLVQWVKKSDIGQIASGLGVSKNAARVIREAIDAEDAAKATARLSAAGDDAMLADAGPASANLLDTVMSDGGKALAIGRKAVDDRASRTNPILRRAFDNILGKPKGVRAAAREISTATAATRKAAYDAAYAVPIDYSSRTGRAIESVIDRIPSRTVEAAVREANEAMQEAGVRNMQIMAQIAPDGSARFVEMPNVIQLDYLKRGLGTVANESKDQSGKLTDAGLRASRLARDLKKAIGDAVPIYNRAVRLGGDKIADEHALALGRSVFSRDVKLEDVTDVMTGKTRTQSTAFKQGLREAIEDTMDNVRGVLSDPNGDAREAAKIWGEFSSKATRKKIEAAIGPAATNRIYRLMEREFPMLSTRSAVARGSQTAYRRAGQEAISDSMEPGVVGTAARGKPIDATARITQVLMNTTPQADRSARQAMMAEIAQALTGIQGRDAQRALAVVRRAIAGQPISEAQARLAGQVVGGVVTLGGGQIGRLRLEAQ